MLTQRGRQERQEREPECGERQEISDLLSRLRNNEMKWRDRHGMLKREGYILRPRLRPGWKPSWLRSGKNPLDCEDGEPLPLRSKCVDATHRESGRMVCIKEVKTNSPEYHAAKLMMKEDWAADHRNHCVPIMKIFEDHEDHRCSYIVMPFLRPADNPPFGTVRDIIGYVSQILEGLVFLHEKGIAHRDCVMRHTLMDGEAMYPKGFHPCNLQRTEDYSAIAQHRSRATAMSEYYFVAFGISVHIPEEVESKLVTGASGIDQDPPELSDLVPYNPFMLDIFIVGNMLKREIYEKFSNVEFLAPLVEAMARVTPHTRADAVQALAIWNGICRNLTTVHREWHLQPRGRNPIGSLSCTDRFKNNRPDYRDYCPIFAVYSSFATSPNPLLIHTFLS
ncbi:hypothetical protein BJ322DRAFT_1142979 [Thelephora terrestris]|uniref:Protein kinase domain-containing protein n=1 Tax=Thelephora terrestris TaxID=56493 RepID=A0A9P6HCZ0_9AGAM|nr:hypothetical protein BJ322DRAFT_1142979 [Thelephora terrestris]